LNRLKWFKSKHFNCQWLRYEKQKNATLIRAIGGMVATPMIKAPGEEVAEQRGPRDAGAGDARWPHAPG